MSKYRLRQILLRLPRWLLTGATVCVILYLTLFPRPVPDDVVPVFPGADKIVHAVMFGWLALMSAIDYGRRGHCLLTVPARVLCIIAVCCVVFGGVVELLQLAMAQGRGAEWSDFAADAAGVMSAVAVANPIIRAFIDKR